MRTLSRACTNFFWLSLPASVLLQRFLACDLMKNVELFATRMLGRLAYIACLVGVLAAPCFAQLEIPNTEQLPEWYFGYDLFQLVLEKRGLESSPYLNDAILRPKESVVILIGDQRKLSTASWNSLRRFISQGGNLLLASDRTSQLSGIGLLDIGTANAGPVVSANPVLKYEGYDDCLIIEDVVQEHPITKGITRLVTNRSGWLTRPNSVRGKTDAWLPLATFPADVSPVSSQGQALIAVSLSKTQNAGSAVVFSDASIFSNAMLWHGDNGLLTIQIADWLCEGNRKKVIFLVDGSPTSRQSKLADTRDSQSKRDQSESNRREQIEMQIKPESLLRFANTAIQKIAESNIANESLRNQPRGISPKMYFQGIWALVAIALGTGIVLVLMKRSKLLVQYLNPRRMRSWHDIQSNQHHPLDQNGFAAETLARQFCRTWTGKDKHAEWQCYLQDIDLELAQSSLTKMERASVKSLVELAVYGKKTLISDDHLIQLNVSIRTLLRHQNANKVLHRGQ